MRRLFASIAFAGLLPFSVVQANVADDLAAQLSASDVLSNALETCLTPESQTCSAAQLDQLMLDVAAVDVALLDSFVTAGIDAGLNAGDIVRAAIKAGANPDEIAQTAILAGADPAEVTEATAAGGPQGQGQGLTIAPGQTGNAVSPPPFGNNAGGGGGGNPSAT